MSRSLFRRPRRANLEQGDAKGGGAGMQFKAWLVTLQVSMVCMAVAPAQSRPLQIEGAAGYLSEWELSGAVTERKSAGGSEFSGPLIWKHVGLCSVNGPQEKHGEIKIRMLRSGLVSRIHATISLEGIRCAYSGEFSGGTRGHMDCSDAKGVPISISIK
jgi:hypothetical protein